jgi:hypothetical protein
MAAPAIGRIVKILLTDFNAGFVHDATLDPSLAPSSELGYYPATIVAVNYRKRDGISLELREGDTVEKLADRCVDFCRERLVCEPTEDKWAILPGKGGQKPPSEQRPSKKPKPSAKHDGKTP